MFKNYYFDQMSLVFYDERPSYVIQSSTHSKLCLAIATHTSKVDKKNNFRPNIRNCQTQVSFIKTAMSYA